MNNVIRALLLGTAFVIATAPSSNAQSAALKGEVLKDWTDLKATMMKIAEAMPEDKFSFKSTPPQRSYGEQILHVATVNLALLQTFGGKATPPAINAKATAKAEILKALSDSFDYGAALINEQSEAGMIEQVQARFLGPSSRLRIAYFLAGHTWDIYGQMAVYLRLNGVVPPASQRP